MSDAVSIEKLSEPEQRPAEPAAEASGRGFLATRKRAIIFSAAVPVLAVVTKLVTPYIIWLMTFSIPRCLMDRLGLRCPLCGGTHCAAAVARGDMARALYYNPYVVCALAFLAVWYIRVVISCFLREYRPARLYRSPERLTWVVLIITVLFEIVRNLPFYRAVMY